MKGLVLSHINKAYFQQKSTAIIMTLRGCFMTINTTTTKLSNQNKKRKNGQIIMKKWLKTLNFALTFILKRNAYDSLGLACAISINQRNSKNFYIRRTKNEKI